MVSGTISLPCQGFFAPFLHSTCPLSVSREYSALPDGPGRFRQDSSCPALLRIPLCFATLRVRSSHALWRDFPDPSTHDALAMTRSYNPGGAETLPVWANPRSLATTWGIMFYFLLLRVIRCFSSPRSPPVKGMTAQQAVGLPHSEIPGSKVICTSPGLIAACHVLRRLREPRHPPCALLCFLPMHGTAVTRPPHIRPYLSTVFCLVLVMFLYSFSQYVKDLLFRGEYRIRTDDLLLAGQAL